MVRLGRESYPWLYPPPGFIPVSRVGSAALLANSTLQTAVISLPVRFAGWITQVGINVSDYTSAYFQILQAGFPIRDYSYVTDNIGAPDTPAARYIELNPNQVFSISFVNNAASNIAVRWSVYGWYFPD